MIREILQAQFTDENSKYEALIFIHYNGGGSLNISQSYIIKASSHCVIHTQSVE